MAASSFPVCVPVARRASLRARSCSRSTPPRTRATTTRSRTAACTGTTATRTPTPAMDSSIAVGSSSSPRKVRREPATPTHRWACTPTNAPKAFAASIPGSRSKTRAATGRPRGRRSRFGRRARHTPKPGPSVFRPRGGGAATFPAQPAPDRPSASPRWAAGKTTRATSFGAARSSIHSARASATAAEASPLRRSAMPPIPSRSSRHSAWVGAETVDAPSRATARSIATRCRSGSRTSRSPTSAFPASGWG